MPFTKMQQFVDAEVQTQSHADRLAILKEIKSDVEAMITATQELAVEDGLAEMKTCQRTNVPNLSWWKANKPKSWEKYCTTSTYERFAWIK